MAVSKGIMTVKKDSGVEVPFYPKTEATLVEGLVNAIENTMSPIVNTKAVLEDTSDIVPKGHLFIESDTGVWKFSDGVHLYSELPPIPMSTSNVVKFTDAVLSSIAPVRKSAEAFRSENLVYPEGRWLIDEFGAIKVGDGATHYIDLEFVGGIGGGAHSEVTYDIRKEDGTYAKGDGVISSDIIFEVLL